MKNLDKVNKVKYFNNNSRLIDANLINNIDKTELNFNYAEINQFLDNLDILSINNLNTNTRSADQKEYQLISVILSEKEDDDNVKIYYRGTKTFHTNNWIKVIFKTQPSEIVNIIKVNNGIITVNLNNDLLDIIYLETSIDDIYLKNRNITDFNFYLTTDILREQNTILTSGNNNECKPNFLIFIGDNYRDNNLTSRELNIISKVVIENESASIQLQFPLMNSHLQGTLLTVKYLYLTISHNIHINQNYLDVISEYDLTKINNCLGCLNWLSNYLTDNGEETEFLTEEYLKINKVSINNTNNYRIHLNNVILNDYIFEPCYLILFVNTELQNDEPTALNFNIEEKWYTGIQLADNYQIPSNFNIQNMKSLNIPTYGLTEMDYSTRCLEYIGNQDDNSEYISEYLSAPNSETVFQNISEPYLRNYMKGIIEHDNFIMIPGRYFGHDGQIQEIYQYENEEIDISYCNLSLGKISELEISPTILPRKLRIPGQHKIKLRVREKKKSQIKKENYYYFCNPLFGHLKTINNNLSNSVFSKIITTNMDLHSELVYTDIFTPNYTKNLDEPIREIDEIQATFIWPNNQLVNFKNKEHSYILEITENLGSLQKINPRMGSII